MEHSFGANIFINVRPMDPVTMTHNLIVRPLFRVASLNRHDHTKGILGFNPIEAQAISQLIELHNANGFE